MSDSTPVSVVVVDDHPAILSGIEAWYAVSRRPITVVAAGSSVQEAWTAPGSTADVVVWKTRYAVRSGLEGAVDEFAHRPARDALLSQAG
ncbi:hypothetical protein [Streptomyces sp. NPDC058665]|uniref:hypothetical protein n=1 Tax=Streptomyces sp. NPDC058665 TaxID=3346586 RepID=UPI003664CFD5